MLGIISIIVAVLIFIYWLFSKPKEKYDGYGNIQSSSDDSFWEKAKDACCSRM